MSSPAQNPAENNEAVVLCSVFDLISVVGLFDSFFKASKAKRMIFCLIFSLFSYPGAVFFNSGVI